LERPLWGSGVRKNPGARLDENSLAHPIDAIRMSCLRLCPCTALAKEDNVVAVGGNVAAEVGVRAGGQLRGPDPSAPTM
jgi:hypothetical protein